MRTGMKSDDQNVTLPSYSTLEWTRRAERSSGFDVEREVAATLTPVLVVLRESPMVFAADRLERETPLHQPCLDSRRHMPNVANGVSVRVRSASAYTVRAATAPVDVVSTATSRPRWRLSDRRSVPSPNSGFLRCER